MKEPGELPPELAPLVSSERDAPTGSAADHRRIRAKLGIGLGVLGTAAGRGAAEGGGVASTTAAAGGGAVGGSIVAKVLVVGVALGAAASGGYVVGRQHAPAPRVESISVERANEVARADVGDAPERPPAQDEAAAPTPPATEHADPVVAVRRAHAPRPAERRDTDAVEPEVIAAEPRPAAPPAAEAAMIAAAWRAVERGDVAGANTAIDEHETRFPDGALAEEREALRVRVLALAGKRRTAEARARAFLVLYPGSIHADAVEGVLKGAE